MPAPLYIGLMSGTSADGVDLALVTFNQNKPALKATYYRPYPKHLQQKITQLYISNDSEIELMGALDIELAQFFAQSINEFIERENLNAEDITAIGNHGQTIRHRPPTSEQKYPFTLQIGCNDTLAALTQIRVIGQFRRKDMAYGGQGAPLVPAFHRAIFSDNQPLFVVNIGGIANVTYLPQDDNQIIGFDTGPGNALLDDWYQQHNHDKSYDEGGHWARTGQINQSLLNHWLTDQYFSLNAPKSTGREYFNAQWLAQTLNSYPNQIFSAEDIQATLVALTAQTITCDIKQIDTHGKVYLCGGGSHNTTLVEQITQALPGYQIIELSSLGYDADALEAMAFAWFAYAFDHSIPGNIPSVTGAKNAVVLGTQYLP